MTQHLHSEVCIWEKWKLVSTKTCTQMFIVTLFIVAPNRSTRYPSTAEWVNEVWCAQGRGIQILRNQKGWIANTCNNLHESPVHYANWSEWDTKGYILYDSIDVIVWNTDVWLPGVQSWGRGWLSGDTGNRLKWWDCFFFFLIVIFFYFRGRERQRVKTKK